MSKIRSAGRMGGQLRVLAPLSAAMVGMGVAASAGAQGNPSGWQYELTPYLWTTSLKGDVKTPTLPSTSVDMSFRDLVGSLDFALSGAFEARKGPWGLFVDAQYYKLSEGGSTSTTGPLGNTLTVDAKLKLKQTILGAGAAYRVVEGHAPVDVIGGLRYTNLDVEVNADFSALGLTGGGTRSGNKDWIDPYIGVRLKYPVSDRWAFVGYADVGGFGVGADFTWQAQVGMEYRVSDKYSVKFGYRVLDVDYDKNGFVYKMRSDGLYAGMGIRF